MIRLSALFVAICAVLIAASAGALLFLALGMSGAESAMVALTALTGLALYNAVAGRRRDRNEAAGQIADLSRGTADLARQVGEQSRRLGALERSNERHNESVADQISRITYPIQSEIGELGVIVQQLAEAAAAHDAALRKPTAINAAAGLPQAPTLAGPVDMTDAMAIAAEALAADRPPTDDPDRPPYAGRSLGGLDRGAPQADGTAASGGPFKGMSREGIVALIRDALEDNRIDLYLQPIVTLPQRKVRYYEALMRLRTPDGTLLAPADFLDFAESGGLMPAIDIMMIYRCVRVVRRLMSKNRDVGLFCNLSFATLGDGEVFPQIAEYLEANRALSHALIFEFPLAAMRAMGQRENDGLAALAAAGFRFSIDHVADLRFEPHDLADRGCRFIKISAALLLEPGAAVGDIDPSDLPGLLGRSGIELIAEKIEQETAVVDLLDFDIKFGQGFLFSPPRPVRPDVMQSEPVVAASLERLAAKPEIGPRVAVAAEPQPKAAKRVAGLAQMARRVARG